MSAGALIAIIVPMFVCLLLMIVFGLCFIYRKQGRIAMRKSRSGEKSSYPEANLTSATEHL